MCRLLFGWLVSNAGLNFGGIFAKSFQAYDGRNRAEGKMSFNQQNTPTIILLKGDTSQGRGQLISNINACLAIQDTVRTTVASPILHII